MIKKNHIVPPCLVQNIRIETKKGHSNERPSQNKEKYSKLLIPN